MSGGSSSYRVPAASPPHRSRRTPLILAALVLSVILLLSVWSGLGHL
jgi:hypothetical protein